MLPPPWQAAAPVLARSLVDLRARPADDGRNVTQHPPGKAVPPRAWAMLLLSLILSVILLCVVNGVVQRSARPWWPVFFCGLGFALVPYCLMMFLPAVLLQVLLLAGAFPLLPRGPPG